MFKLSKEEIQALKGVDKIRVKMACMICMSFPEVILLNTSEWEQSANPVPSNRMCFHLKHKLNCPNCKYELATVQEVRETYFTESSFKESILKRDDFTCQACGYKQTRKPSTIGRRKKNESEAEYLHRRFVSSLARSNEDKSLAVAHYAKRYKKESYENRHKIENARTLCIDCHNMETAKHQTEAWLSLMETCSWLKNLE